MIDLAPSFAMLKAAKLPGGAKVFDDAFENHLTTLDPGLVAEKLRQLQNAATDSRGVVLLCYEDVRLPGARCHRLQVARWLSGHLGIEIGELPE
jgi:ABC-type histidine transport system ATPase subunit